MSIETWLKLDEHDRAAWLFPEQLGKLKPVPPRFAANVRSLLRESTMLAKSAGFDPDEHPRDHETGRFVSKIHPDTKPIATPGGPYFPTVSIGGKPAPVEIASYHRSDLAGLQAWRDEADRMYDEHKESNPWVKLLSYWATHPDYFEQYLQSVNGSAVTLKSGDRVLGMAILAHDKAGKLFLETLQACPDSARVKTDPKHVGGVGTALLAAAVSEAIGRHHAEEIHADILPEAAGFYRKMERYRTPDRPGLEFNGPDAVRFRHGGAITFLDQVMKGTSHERDD